MTDTPPLPDRPSSADSLPPIEPPNANFIIQLFIIPAVIVAIIIAVWALFNWLAHMGNDPRSYVEALKRNNESRWQEAVNLANELRKSGNEGLRKDATLAGELAQMLSDEIDAGGFDDKAVTLRVYLCRVLGEFDVPDVLPTLIKAAKTERDERERDVRLAALQGLARSIEKLDPAAVASQPALAEVLVTASEDPDRVVRYHAAYVLGVLGGESSRQRLHVLLGDADADVRMNAATGLARSGDRAGETMLIAMLEASDPALTAGEQDEAARPIKRLTIQYNALESVGELAKKLPASDLTALAAAVDRLIAANPQADIRAKAEEAKAALAKATGS